MKRRSRQGQASFPRGPLLALLLGGLLAGCASRPEAAAGGDVTAPTVLSTIPAGAATGVPVGLAISVVFSEPMNVGSVAVTLVPSAGLGSPQWSAGNTVVTFHPPVALLADTSYALGVSGQDTAGNALAFSGATFRTAPATGGASTWDVALWDQGTWQ
jgi:hypothetical protein